MDYYEKLFGERFYYRQAFKLVRIERKSQSSECGLPVFFYNQLSWYRAMCPLALSAAYRSLQMRDSDAH